MILKTSVLLSMVLFSYASKLSLKDANNCPQLELTCSEDCASINYCISINATAIPIENCRNSETFCQSINGVPTCSANSCDKVFCGVTGNIPSPRNCSLYYICEESEGETRDLRSCPEDTSFDSKTRTCTSEACNREPVKCENTETNGKLGDFCYQCTGKDQYLISDCGNLINFP